MTEAPAAYSVDDLRFDPAIGARLDIMLDGKPVTKVVAYDTIKGQVLRLKTGEDGNLVLNAARDDVVRELLEGKVEARLRSE
ncbi:hypothetical protein CMI47_05120 [Candidatus Pacearchaeota archaeon]|jgi:hypothetical protein|nr:hypothetical protein [Candidatus Pacearchaeota archaeon]|tara:strand:- start:320 stop:565 length:246 start_codon:yes stop_codon:yes gene_type:complete